jgi:hypothetical protein
MDSAEHPRPVTTDPIALYLAQLELALAGRNPALVHDAIVDAESHLRAAVAGGASPQQAVDDFGAPGDIARAYIEADRPRAGLPRNALDSMLEPSRGSPHLGDAVGGHTPSGAASGDAAGVSASTVPGASSPLPGAAVGGAAGFGQARASFVPQEPFLTRARRVPVLGIWFHPHAWGSLLYFTTIGFAFSVVVFTWVVSVGLLSLGLLPILIGLVLLVLLLGSVRGLCLADGWLCQTFLGVRMPRRTQPVYTTSGISLWQRLGCWLRDVRSWLSLGYLVGNFPVAVVLFVLFISLVSTSAVLVGAPFATLFDEPLVVSAEGPDSVRILGQDFQRDGGGNYQVPFVTTIFMFLVGVLLATCTLWLARGIGWVYGHVVQAIQVARPRAVIVRPVETQS